MNIRVNATYRAKKPVKKWSDRDGNPVYNDRLVLWVSADGERVQYDGPAVAPGRRYPTVSREKFLKWAGHEV